MSAAIGTAARPRARTAAAASSRLARSRPVSTMSAPTSASARAISRPSPRLPPVTSARRPSRRKRSSTLMCTSDGEAGTPVDAVAAGHRQTGARRYAKRGENTSRSAGRGRPPRWRQFAADDDGYPCARWPTRNRQRRIIWRAPDSTDWERVKPFSHPGADTLVDSASLLHDFAVAMLALAACARRP